MSVPDRGREPLDPQVSGDDREGLAGTAPASVYGSWREREDVTIAPDFAPLDAQPAWRQDFPIDWPRDHYVERRDFMRFMVLTSAAFAVGQLWIGVQNWWRGRTTTPPLRIASTGDLPVGGALVFHYPGEHDACLLVRLAEAEFVAFSQKCTHLACAVIPRPAEGHFHCPCHSGYFDLRTGVPTAGPPNRPLPRIRLEVRGSEIYATGVDPRTT